MSVLATRVLITAPAVTWSLDSTALALTLTSVPPVQRHTANTTTLVVTVVFVTALGCVTVFPATSATTAAPSTRAIR